MYAQGGVAVAPEEDDIALHREDTLREIGRAHV